MKKKYKKSPTLCTTTPFFPFRWTAQWLRFFFRILFLWSCFHTATGAFINQRAAGLNRSMLKWHIGKVRPQGFCGAR